MQSNNEKKKTIISITVYITGLVLCLFCGIFLGHPDAHTLTGWAKDLLYCIFSGRFTRFPEYTFVLRNNATNYSMLANLVMALFMYPIYAVDEALGLNLDFFIYVFYEKIIMLIITLVDVHLFGSVLDDLGYSTANRRYAKGLFMCSAIVCVATVAKGQTDALVMLFVFIAAKMFLKKRFWLTGLFLGISLVIKPFTVLLTVPVLLLLIGELSVRGIILPSVFAALPFILDHVATRLFWPGYYYMKTHTDDATRILFGQTRAESLFSMVFGEVELFLASVLIVCFICLYKGVNRSVKRGDYAIYPMVLYIALSIFVSATYYWFIVMVPMWILLGFRMKSRWSLPLLLAGNSIGALVQLIFNEYTYHVSFFYNLPGQLWGAPFPIQYDLGDFHVIWVRSGVTLFIVTQILMLVLYFMEEDRQ